MSIINKTDLFFEIKLGNYTKKFVSSLYIYLFICQIDSINILYDAKKCICIVFLRCIVSLKVVTVTARFRILELTKMLRASFCFHRFVNISHKLSI